MEYAAGLLSGVAASALFWVFDTYLVSLPKPYQVVGAIACFVIFSGAGYWLASRKSQAPTLPRGTRVGTNVRGRNVKLRVEGVSTSGGANILTEIRAKGDLDATAKNIETDR